MTDREERLKKMAELYEQKAEAAKEAGDMMLAEQMTIASLRSWDEYYKEKRNR